jgi:hypothetical protein
MDPGPYRPRAVFLKMLFDVPKQPVQGLLRVIARALVLNITECSIDWIYPRTTGRKPLDVKSWVLREPAINSLRFMDFIVVQDQEDTFDFQSANLFERPEQFSEKRIVFSVSDDLMDLGSPIAERSGQILLLVLPRGWNLNLGALEHPLITDFCQEMNVEFVTPEESIRRL